MDESLLVPVTALGATLLLAVSIPVVFIILSSWLGPKKGNPTKLSPYECGIGSEATTGDARSHFNIKFYLVAMCFLVFDVEVVFLFPWAVWFRDQASLGMAAITAFLAVLAVGWFYLWKRGALEWE